MMVTSVAPTVTADDTTSFHYQPFFINDATPAMTPSNWSYGTDKIGGQAGD